MRSFLTSSVLVLPMLMLAACGSNETEREQSQPQSAVPGADANDADEMASRDPAPGASLENEIPDSEARPVMQAQVVLERLGFGPGVIDGKEGISFTNAVKGFQELRGLEVTGQIDEPTKQALSRWDNIPATRVVTIPRSWGEIEFPPIPEDAPEQAEMTRLGYESMAEKLAERFHTTPAVLAQLNPGGRPAQARGGSSAAPTATSTGSSSNSASDQAPVFAPGQRLRVPNVGADRIVAGEVDDKDWLETLRSLGVGTDQPSVARILVDESEGLLKAYDEEDRLVAMYTVTTGSQNDPLPIGDWRVNGVAYNPPFAYDPTLFWDVADSEESQQLPPGPNGPVGVVWIDLSKEHYGIHGTSTPETIGRVQSHGCVRLTNWDAARLAQMVSGSTKVVFQE
jgi:lipoprotein-anchoring transpeptidase ErfK/SrfK